MKNCIFEALLPDEFEDQFIPLVNPFDKTLGLNGTLIDANDPEQWQYVQSAFKTKRAWCMLDVDGHLILKPNIFITNIYAFMVTKHPYKNINCEVHYD